MRRVVVTGIGVIAPVGVDTATFWDNCLAAVSSVAPIPEAWRPYYSFSSTIWAPLSPVDFMRYRISRLELMQNDMTALLALAAAEQALSMGGVDVSLRNEKKNVYALNNIHAERCGIFLGTGIGGIVSFAANEAHHILAPVHAKLHEGGLGPASADRAVPVQEDFSQLVRFPPRYHPFAAAMSMPNTAAAALGIKYSLHGPNMTVCNACAAGTTAVGRAFMAIRGGEADCALAGGVEYLRDDYGGIFRAFDVAKTLVHAGAGPDAANRPFDKDRTGFLFAEGGGAVLLLESQDHACSRHATPLAEICSFAETFDGFSMMSPEPSGREIEGLVRTVLANAKMSASDIDYINAHGTGTPVSDEIEAGVIERVFGNKPLVNATKSLTGHSIGASGAIETAVTALSIRSQTTHICKNLHNPIRPLRFVREVRPYPIHAALTQSFAFGGHNAALVLSRY